ncbi:UbiX family flavin prenyltransferase [Campylobacter hepaticus]|uniref:UbiX family flavin prenyltransferase n=1 Tax=Campylobacter hepaticus TaxID=1813019 RepID=A0A424Z2M1_9BACT|nr:UbiX family flavin prenyltransferase [Campylobacter hepaticus]AXP08674.1 UbiX family flavin prenyltransferase [Campylobacter hepaticus]MCZ0772518.1 UbiX family flavin prenyltransferase [Campylobacter hepaticus]MCZ0773986.1 UbiX family flavin prenyltransferase [Campylobacter hepaticus]MCZ0775238.1 UbiX family flavin prenyltransferase [Campylobacter hepaticus]MDX2323261.1 UbiX family flavin prenyltransferase [Campylobacter hepaticus]
MKILLGISGSSSVYLGLKLLKHLENKCELYCILTQGSKISFQAENKTNLEEICQKKFKNTHFLNDNDLSLSVASGSFGIEKTIIAPCSISSLAKIHAGFADTLLMRAAAVALKERKKLILAIREMPFSTLNLEHMLKLSQMNVIIAPPVFASYSKIDNLQDLENFIIGKWLDLLEIKHDLYKKWQNF